MGKLLRNNDKSCTLNSVARDELNRIKLNSRLYPFKTRDKQKWMEWDHTQRPIKMKSKIYVLHTQEIPQSRPENTWHRCHHKVHIFLEYHSFCPLVRIGTPPLPLPQASVSFPRNHRGWGHTCQDEVVGESRFGRLEKKPGTLCLLCGYHPEEWCWNSSRHVFLTLLSIVCLHALCFRLRYFERLARNCIKQF